jgi:hypothetical protein
MQVKRQLDIMVLKLGPTRTCQVEGKRTKETCWSSALYLGELIGGVCVVDAMSERVEPSGYHREGFIYDFCSGLG